MDMESRSRSGCLTEKRHCAGKCYLGLRRAFAEPDNSTVAVLVNDFDAGRSLVAMPAVGPYDDNQARSFKK